MKRSLVHAQSGRYLRKAYRQSVPARNVLVTRDPYRRLFSAYVDKQMLRLPTHDVNSSKLICGNYVTFDRFLSHILSKGFRGGYLDRHVAPIALLCEPCDTRYEFVAKQETLTEDITFLLENVTVVPKRTRELILRVLHGEVNARTLIGVIDTLVQRALDTCSNILDYISSLWTVFKIQGIIRYDIVFPREYLEQLPTVDVSVVTSVVKQAIAFHPLTIEDRNKQRRHALVTAYAGVSSHTIRGIQDMYFKDFVLFDYDIQPPL
ncbi:uncharacterized protein LOC110463660 [Mizuhopecten yessoensis]|nr:uncharacterized protein LOC110463660 [Mizuhopecten yessoensis]